MATSVLGRSTPRNRTMASAWATKKKEQMERAAALRARREVNTPFGGGGGSGGGGGGFFSAGLGGGFLDRLFAAEQRDAEKHDDLAAKAKRQPFETPSRSARMAAALDERSGRSGKVKTKKKQKATPATLPANTAEPRRRKRPVVRHGAASQIAADNERKLHTQLKARVAAQGASGHARPPVDPSRVLPGLGYEPLGPIAAGAFATILRCRSTASGAIVAVKSFDAVRCASNEDLKATRDNEMAILRRLRAAAAGGGGGGGGGGSPFGGLFGGGGAAGGLHPHIANMLEELGDEASSHQHAVLEYCEGGSLKRHLQAIKGPMPPAQAALATQQLAGALEHLHSLGMAHRDVKPANVLLCAAAGSSSGSDGGGGGGGGKGGGAAALHLKLCDFGFACHCGERKLKLHLGTPMYLAPEIASPADAHKGYLGRPVDMWALGCVVFEMLHNPRLAFKSEERFELENLIRRCNYQPFDKATAPPGARALISGLLVASPTARLTALQVLAHPWVAGLGASAAPPLPPQPPAR